HGCDLFRGAIRLRRPDEGWDVALDRAIFARGDAAVAAVGGEMRTLLFLLSLVPILAGAQDYPSKPVRVIVGTSPGGSPDVFARLVTAKMAEAWGASFVVENKVGANGNIAAEMVSRSAPDGYTLYFCDSAIWAINPHVYAKVPYNPLGDFAGVSTVATLPTFLTV